MFLVVFLPLVGCLTEPNQRPIITSDPVKTATVGLSYTYDVDATDPDGDTLTYSLTVKPGDMAIDSGTGKITWIPTAVGDYNVAVEVSDEKLSDSQSFTIEVSTVEITGIEVKPDEMTIVVGGSEAIKSVTATYEIKAEFEALIPLEDCTYASNALQIATVNSNFEVEAVAAGEAIITVTYASKTDTLEVTVVLPVHNITQDTYHNTIQDAINKANPGDIIEVAAGTYDETVTIGAGKDNLTILGEDRATTVIANGIKFNLASDLSGVTISNFTVRGNAGTYSNGVTVGHTGTGYLRNVEFTNNLFNGQDTTGMCFYINPVAGTFSLINNEITGYTDWGTVYIGEGILEAGSSGPSLSTVLFEGNHIHYNKGSSVVYGNADDFTNHFVVRNNEFVNNGGHEWFWATIEIRNAANLLVENNLFEGSPVGMEGVHGAGLYLTNDNDGLFSGSITGNQFVNNWQGIYVFSGDVGGLSAHLNNFLGNDIGIEIGTEATVLGPLDATYNWWGSKYGPKHNGFPVNGGDAVSDNVDYEHFLTSEY